MEKLKELYGNDKQNHAAYMQAKAQITSDYLNNLVEKTAVVYNGINGILSASSSYAQACSDLEQAKISKTTKADCCSWQQLEEKKSWRRSVTRSWQLPSLRLTKSHEDRNCPGDSIYSYVCYQCLCICCSYTNNRLDISSYCSRYGHSCRYDTACCYQKQHQAEAAGYYEGGYTGGNRYRKEAGVVHEGEFVANHRAVNNSSIRPALDLIDKAQRSNTVGSLTADDITRSLGQGSSTVVAPVVNVNNDNTEVRQSLDGVNAAVSRLTQTLDDGIEVEVPISGRRGLHRRLQDYQRILNNK